MPKKPRKETVLMSDNKNNPLIKDCTAMFEKVGFSETEIEFFSEDATEVLDEYTAALGKAAR